MKTTVSLALLLSLSLTQFGCASFASNRAAEPALAELAQDDPDKREVTVVIALSSILPGGIIGHTGIAVDDQYWDFGPERTDRFQKKRAFDSNAGPWWDDPDQQWENDRSLAEVFEAMPEMLKPEGSIVALMTIEVTDEQADQLIAFWDGCYARMRQGEEQYELRNKQCANVVAWSLSSAIKSASPIEQMPQQMRLMTPTALYQHLSSSLVHTAGDQVGEPAEVMHLQLKSDGIERWQPAIQWTRDGVPVIPRTRLAYERIEHLPAKWWVAGKDKLKSF